MVESTLSQALKEAYASAPAGVFILETIELRHPTFDAPFRLVRDSRDLNATLEADAPLNGGEEVLFTAFPFQIRLPSISDRSIAEATVTIDNIGRELTDMIEKATESLQPIRLSYRPYLSTDTSAPHYNRPLHLTLTDIRVDVFRVQARAGFSDIANKNMPSILYEAETFKGLAR